MSNVISMPKGEVAVIDPAIIESIVTKGDLSGLNQVQKVQYYNYRCKQIGLDPSAKPFDLLNLSGKQVLYANAGATQQLCNLHRLSTQITNKERLDDIYVVSVRVTGADGRSSENQGAVSIGGLRGDGLANAILKCTTKAIRRSVLAHCGLGMLDETEVETIPNAHKENIVIPQAEPIPTVIEEPQGDWALLLPGSDDPYSYHQNEDDYLAAFEKMGIKILDSKKLSAEEKVQKISDLISANEATQSLLKSVHVEIADRITAGLLKAASDALPK
jgi:hypothetical protein